MEKLTTILEISKQYNLHVNTVRWLANNANIKRQITTKKQINGYIGHAYLKSDLEAEIKAYFERKMLTGLKEQEKQNQSLKDPKKHKLSFVCEVLRKHLKSSLNNKVLSLWTRDDWVEFNEMITD